MSPTRCFSVALLLSFACSDADSAATDPVAAAGAADQPLMPGAGMAGMAGAPVQPMPSMTSAPPPVGGMTGAGPTAGGAPSAGGGATGAVPMAGATGMAMGGTGGLGMLGEPEMMPPMTGGMAGSPNEEGGAPPVAGSEGEMGGESTMDPPEAGSAGEPDVEPGACEKGTTAANEVVFIGESFIAASSIAQETSNLAIANGSLQSGQSYLNASVSGTRLGDGAIPRQYTQTAASNPIRFVLMNGGGNDCLQAGDPNSPIPAAEKLYEEMAADGVEKVVYFFYPDAAGAFGGPTSSLQTCLEEYRPKIKALCDSLTAPKCYWLDLAETSWDGNEDAYTSDGIHPNAQGSKVTAEAIWEVMVENCVAQ